MDKWTEAFEEKLAHQYGKKKAAVLSNKYSKHFPAGYKDDFDAETAVEDLEKLEALSEQNSLEMRLYSTQSAHGRSMHLRLFQWRNPVPLSDVLPMMENFHLRTLAEHPYKITINQHSAWINDFLVEFKEDWIELDDNSVSLFEEAFRQVYLGIAENDGFNKLVLGASLSWKEVIILRAYAKYLHQIQFRFSHVYIEKALMKNADLAYDLITLFHCLHNPESPKSNKKQLEDIQLRINEKLELIPELDEDTIIRRLLDVINATVRTNYFQTTNEGADKSYLAFKFHSRLIPELPLPAPLYETFIYSARFEGIHLRNEKIARGGLRWSDRLEDYRTEILGLMKAQVVKNSVIVPSGAKGGFTLKQVPFGANREFIINEVTECYSLFISGLLDITDNIIDGERIFPPQVVCHDEFDPYLVVAADKGTATFSDLANQIAATYNFWLGDAFASGGSTGYDHKKMGITARGAWESAKRHLRELEINLEKAVITMVGIGDMSGDVFGNGLLYSDNIKLIAAFDHRHIFVDPDPDPKRSFKERMRLFKLPASSWDDYDKRLISQGGNVFKRSLKSIPVTYEMTQALGIEAASVTPDELIQCILKAPVDLLFNGGVGTYVKASSETDAEVGDRSNDRCRINGNELRARIVCEGGNLGFTQLGRIEFALKGGLINSDFIDNSAGVDCSDHEVNLKILLNQEVEQGSLTLAARNKLLASLTDEIATLVLSDNYHQALALSFAAFNTKHEIAEQADYIRTLEAQALVNRRVEFLPEDKTLVERKVEKIGLTRPELAVLLAYTKIYLKQAILASALPDDPYVEKLLADAFPAVISKKYKQAMNDHQLKRIIIATQLANDVVNNAGIIFVFKTQKETGASIDDIIRAYIAASSIFETNELQRLVERLDYKISLAEQYDIIKNIRQLITVATRWFLQENRLEGDLEQLIADYSTSVRQLEKIIPNLMGGITKQYLASLMQQFQEAGLSKTVARRIATYRAIYTSLNIIEVVNQHQVELKETAKIYFAAGEQLHLLWFRDQIANDNQEGHWNRLARLALRDELDAAQRALTVAIMKTTKAHSQAHKRIACWMEQNQKTVVRWENLLSMLQENAAIEYNMFFIVIREFIRTLQSVKSVNL